MPTEPFLRDVFWMRSLRRQHVERVLNAAYVTVHETDAYVATAGSEAVPRLGVESGLLKISGGVRCGKVVMFTNVPAGGRVGEGSVIKRERRRYDVIAMRRTRVLHVPAPTFMWLLQVSNEFARFVIDA